MTLSLTCVILRGGLIELPLDLEPPLTGMEARLRLFPCCLNGWSVEIEKQTNSDVMRDVTDSLLTWLCLSFRRTEGSEASLPLCVLPACLPLTNQMPWLAVPSWSYRRLLSLRSECCFCVSWCLVLCCAFSSFLSLSPNTLHGVHSWFVAAFFEVLEMSK